MNRAEITKHIEQNQKSITDQIENTLKTHSMNTERLLTERLASDQAEIKNALKEHRTKIMAYTDKTIKEKMTCKILDMNYQVLITILLVMIFIFQIYILIKIGR